MLSKRQARYPQMPRSATERVSRLRSGSRCIAILSPDAPALPFGYRRDSSMVTFRVATTGAPSPVVAVVALAAILLTTFTALEDVEV